MLKFIQSFTNYSSDHYTDIYGIWRDREDHETPLPLGEDDTLWYPNYTPQIEKRLQEIREEIIKRVDQIYAIKDIDPAFYMDVIESSKTDFPAIREQIKNSPELQNHSHELLFFVLEIEAACKLLHSKNSIVQNRRKGTSKRSDALPLQKGQVKTFTPANGLTNLRELYKNLKSSASLLDPISIEDFNKLFSGKPETLTINWKAQKNQLCYFVQQLIKKEYIVTHGAWISAEHYFTYRGDKISPKMLKGADDLKIMSKKRDIDALFPAKGNTLLNK